MGRQVHRVIRSLHPGLAIITTSVTPTAVTSHIPHFFILTLSIFISPLTNYLRTDTYID
jgi:hypothetical protein